MKDGFLAKGSGNGPFAVGYYDASDMLFTEQLVRRFTTADRWHSSLLGPTFPNRQYLHAAQSARQKHDPGPAEARHVHHEDHLGQPARRQGAVGVLLHRPADRDVVG